MGLWISYSFKTSNYVLLLPCSLITKINRNVKFHGFNVVFHPGEQSDQTIKHRIVKQCCLSFAHMLYYAGVENKLVSNVKH